MLSRSNSITSIVSTYASSPEPLTSDFIFQPKEGENLSEHTNFSKHSSAKHSTHITNPPPFSPSSELGSEQTTTVDIALVSGNSGHEPEEPEEEQEGDGEEEDSASVIEQSHNNDRTEVASSVASSVSTSSGISSRKREKTPSSVKEFSAPPTPAPPPQPEVTTESKKKAKRPGKALSAEIEALLQYNRNMAPTTTKLPGRQTNNSLSSVTGPVILPFAEASSPKASSNSSGSKSAEPSTGGGGSAAGRKKKSKSSEV